MHVNVPSIVLALPAITCSYTCRLHDLSMYVYEGYHTRSINKSEKRKRYAVRAVILLIAAVSKSLQSPYRFNSADESMQMTFEVN